MSLIKVFKYFLIASLIAVQSVCADSIVTGSKPYTFVPGTIISSSQVNADFDYIITQVNTNAAKNGVNSSITALLGMTTPLGLTSGGSPVYTASSATGGTANAQTIATTVPAVSSYSLSSKNVVCFTAGATNTGATTLAVGATAASAVTKTSSGGLLALVGGEIVNGQSYCSYWDGTQYVLLNIPPIFGSQTSIASATTTDLGTASTNNILITGTTGITSFGTTASISNPLFFVKFADVVTLTYNATSLITPNAADITTQANDIIWVEYLGSGNWRVRQYISFRIPTVQIFLSGSGTYTPTSTNIRYIKVKMVAGGGGGGGATANSGAAGVASSFDTWTVDFGSGGNSSTTRGAGGSGGTDGTGTLIARINGQDGGAGGDSGLPIAPDGGSTCFGPGARGTVSSSSGQNAFANSGGGGSSGISSGNSGSGGGGGECVEFTMTYASVASGVSYEVGTGGAGGAAGGQAGGDGGSGRIVVEEFYDQ
jgi:hypothetical protein